MGHGGKKKTKKKHLGTMPTAAAAASSDDSAAGDNNTIDLSTDEGNDDLQKGIALSLQDQQKKSPDGISAEEQEVSRALEASLKESQPQATIETLNPRKRMREHGSHIGIKNNNTYLLAGYMIRSSSALNFSEW